MTPRITSLVCRAVSLAGGARWPVPWPGGARTGSFAANVVCMLTGTVLGQAASIMLSPLLTRLYVPEQFGQLSVFTATLTILGVIAALGFELAIPIARSHDEFANLLAASAAALVGMTALLALATWLIPGRMLGPLLRDPPLSFRILLPFGFCCIGGYYIMVAAATRLAAFRDIASTRLSQGVGGPLAQIGLGLLGAGTPGLLIGFVIGQSSGVFLLFSRVLLRSPVRLVHVSQRGVTAAIRRYARFPLFASWAKLLEMAGSGPVLFLLYAACYSTEIAGYLFLTERVIARPLLMVSTSLLQVFTGEAGQAVHADPETLRRRFRQVIPLQFLLSATWILLANLLAVQAFPILFGPQWAAAIPYLRASSMAYLALAVLHPVSMSLQILERQVVAVVWQAGRLGLLVGCVVVGWRLGLSAVTVLWLGSIVQVAACMAMLVLIATSIERIQRT